VSKRAQLKTSSGLLQTQSKDVAVLTPHLEILLMSFARVMSWPPPCGRRPPSLRRLPALPGLSIKSFEGYYLKVKARICLVCAIFGSSSIDSPQVLESAKQQIPSFLLEMSRSPEARQKARGQCERVLC